MPHWFTVIALVVLLAACATAPPPSPPADSAADQCLQMYQTIDDLNRAVGIVSPSRPARIAGFPYLRVNRFLAAYRDEDLGNAALRSWLNQLAQLDRTARTIEFNAMPEALQDRVRVTYGGDLSKALKDCSETLLAQDLFDPGRLILLKKNARVPSEYLTANQVLGLYPIASLPVSVGVGRYHREVHASYGQSLASLPIEGELHRYQSPPDLGISIARIPRDELGVPQPHPEQLDALFARHAPIWEIDSVGQYDFPGIPIWRGDDSPAIDPTVPVVYRFVSYTRWLGMAKLQLNYLIWFDQRPLQGKFDILGGRLDGLIWRVTLNGDGAVLIYDTIHPCGCYHMFFPTQVLQLRAQAAQLPEPPLVPQAAPELALGEHMVLRIASGTHYLQRVYADSPSGILYNWRPYSDLYATVIAGERTTRSLFDAYGIVPGSERRERYLLWPTGVASPGAMRERGRHAVAFVGRRHFDDPDLLERLFQPSVHD